MSEITELYYALRIDLEQKTKELERLSFNSSILSFRL